MSPVCRSGRSRSPGVYSGNLRYVRAGLSRHPPRVGRLALDEHSVYPDANVRFRYAGPSRVNVGPPLTLVGCSLLT